VTTAPRRPDREPGRGPAAQPRMRGTICHFVTERGFGFVRPDAGGENVFVHITAALRAGIDDLAVGDVLEFDVSTDRRGRTEAINIRLVATRAGGAA